VTCRRCSLTLCICGVIDDRATRIGNLAIAIVCVAVYAGAFCWAWWP